jgi:hypothetical protein
VTSFTSARSVEPHANILTVRGGKSSTDRMTCRITDALGRISAQALVLSLAAFTLAAQ